MNNEKIKKQISNTRTRKQRLLDLSFEDDIFYFRAAVEDIDMEEAMTHLNALQNMINDAKFIIAN